MNSMTRRPPAFDTPVKPPAEDAPRARKVRSGPFGVLDIGSSKIACMIGRAESDGRLRSLGFGWQRSQGIKSGGIVDLDAAERAIRAAVGTAEELADTRLKSVYVNLSCGQPESRLFNVQWPVDGRAVTADDIKRVVREARTRAAAEGRATIHALPLSFATDETQGITDPRGLFCDTLTAQLHVIDSGSTALRTLSACLSRCELDIAGLISAPLASGLAVLVGDERELGTTVIDMGGGTTTIAVFSEGQVLHTAQIPVGGNHVTTDIAQGLSTSIAHAERLKALYGNCHSSPDDSRELLPVPMVGEAEHQIAQMPRSHLIACIRPRLEEIFELVKDQLETAGLGRAGGVRVVLTGGASQLGGVRELAAQILDRHVRLGRPGAVIGLPDSANSPNFATLIGLLAFATGDGQSMQDIDFNTERYRGWFGRFVDFLKNRV
ncbi:cell division protein FtsA [Acidocella sp. KAb 2-4]|uniref:cell division protein FtsA n=1 Tax=Acidocella sp. KAb 2-4 TaxID=2885158 RepID=UPI001D06B1A9|nr:cell division protein FtsA [Acidocella sp. KAb 2-4]MCB5946009.1 cell division protein FtsA [Acidocella sp. KAb 2-4]